MTAYELADFIDKYCEDNTSKEAAVLLRQQADRIAELEKELDRCKQSEKEGWRYSNELEAERKRLSEQCDAVYWVDDLSNSEAVSNQLKQELQLKHFTIPLYTTPQTKPLSKPEECKDGCPELQVCDYCQQTKPLSDEEIKQIWYNLYPLSSSSYWDDKREGLAELKFARAILRKAQEK